MISQQRTFIRVLPTRWRQKPAGIDMERNDVNVTLCIDHTLSYHLQLSRSQGNGRITHTHNRLTAVGPGRPVPQQTLTHSHSSWSSDMLYHLPPFTTISGIHFVHFTCLTVLSYNLSPGPLWSSSWSWTLNFILHIFLHPIIIFFSQHMPIPT